MFDIFQKKDYFGNRFPGERKLYKKYGNCRRLSADKLTFLCISDTHGNINEDELKKKTESPYNFAVLLGDMEFGDIETIMDYIPGNKLYGILGNHDEDWIAKYGITSIHLKFASVNGVKFMGVGGVCKYKPGDYPSFTQNESREVLKNKETVDILFSHDGAYDEARRIPFGFGESHQGAYGITEYIFQRGVPFLIHGHNHKSYEYQYLNGSREICLDMGEIKRFELKGGNLEICPN